MTDAAVSAQEPSLADEYLRTRLPIPADRRRVRETARFGLRRFAARVRVSHGSIAYYERGGTPSPDIAERYKRELEELAAVLGIELRYDQPIAVQK